MLQGKRSTERDLRNRLLLAEGTEAKETQEWAAQTPAQGTPEAAGLAKAQAVQMYASKGDLVVTQQGHNRGCVTIDAKNLMLPGDRKLLEVVGQSSGILCT